MSVTKRFAGLFFAAAIFCAPQAGRTETYVWDGSSNPNWGVVDNWTNGLAFVDGSDVLFYDTGALNFSNTFLGLAGTNRIVGTLTFGANATSPVNIYSNTLTLLNGIVFDPLSTSHGIFSTLVISNDQTWYLNAGQTLTVGAVNDPTGNDRNLTVSNGTVLLTAGGSVNQWRMRNGATLAINANNRLGDTSTSVDLDSDSVLDMRNFTDAWRGLSGTGTVTNYGAGNLDLRPIAGDQWVFSGRVFATNNGIGSSWVMQGGRGTVGTQIFESTLPFQSDLQILNGVGVLRGANGSAASAVGSINLGQVAVDTANLGTNSTLVLDSSTGNYSGLSRLDANEQINLRTSGQLTIIGNDSADTVEDVGSLSVTAANESRPSVIVTVDAGTGAGARLDANSLVRAANSGSILFRGDNLGMGPIGAGTSLITFAAAPTLSGAGTLGTPQAGILPYAIGDNSPTGNGTDFVTYDANGVRLLNASEYTGAFGSGANVELTSSPAALAGPTADLALKINGGTPIDVDLGGNTLTLSAGAILNTGTAGVTNTINNGTITFGNNAATAYEGFIHNLRDLNLNATIANNGANAVSITKTGNGTLIISTNQTYTGRTILNDGITIIQGTNFLGQGALNLDGILVITNGAAQKVAGLGGSSRGIVNIGPNSTFEMTSGLDGFYGTFVGGSSADLIKSGSGTETLYGNSSAYSGEVFVQGGTLRLFMANGRLTAVPSFYIRNGGTLDLANNQGNNQGQSDRIGNTADFYMDTGNFTINGVRNGATTETIDDITLRSGYNTFTLDPIETSLGTPSSDGDVSFVADVFTRQNKATGLIRGDRLGENLSLGTNSQFRLNQTFTNQLTDQSWKVKSAGADDLPIVPWLTGGTNIADVGSTFVTYQTNFGFRPLNVETEFVNQYFAATGSVNVATASNFNFRVSYGSVASANVAENLKVLGLVLFNTNNSANDLVIADGATLTVSNGLILSTGSADNGIRGGNLTFGTNFSTGTEGRIHGVRRIDIDSVIVDNGSQPVSLTTDGLVVLNTNATYTGETAVSSGELRVTRNNALPTVATRVEGALTLNGTTTQRIDSLISASTGAGGIVSNSTASSVLELAGMRASQSYYGQIIAPITSRIVKMGTNTQTFLGFQTNFLGDIFASGGTLELAGAAGSLANARSYRIDNGGTLEIDNNTGAINLNHNNRLSDTATNTLRRGTLIARGSQSDRSDENIGNVIFEAGYNTITLDADESAANTLGLAGDIRLTANRLIRLNRATGVIRGDRLGVDLDSGVGIDDGQSQFVLDGMDGTTLLSHAQTTPGTTDLGVIPWLVGSTNSGATDSLLTYDTTYGFRPLDLNTEFVNEAYAAAGTVNAGLASNNNFRILWTANNADATLGAGTNMTVRGLVLHNTGNTGSDFNIGNNTLTVESGIILATGTQTVEIAGTTGGRLTFGNNAATGYEGYINGSRRIEIKTRIDDNVSGDGTVTNAVSLTTDGEVYLYTNNTYSGDTFINSGRIEVSGGDDKLPVGTVVTANGNGTLRLYGGNQRIAGLQGEGFVDNANTGANVRTLTISNENNYAFSGGIIDGSSAALRLVKQGGGIQTLSGTNTYTGFTRIEQGTLFAMQAMALSNYVTFGRITNNAGGVLAARAGRATEWTSPQIETLLSNTWFNAGSYFDIDVDSGQSFTYGGFVSNAAGFSTLQSFLKSGAGTLATTNGISLPGDVGVLGGTVIASGSSAYARDVFLTNSTILNLLVPDAAFRNADIRASASLFVTNPGALSAAFTNITSAGTLRVFAQTNSFQDLTTTAGAASFVGATTYGRDVTVTNSTVTIVGTNLAFRNIDVQRGGTFQITNNPGFGSVLTADFTNIQSAGAINLLARTNTLVDLNILDGGGTIGGDFVQGTGIFNTTTNFSTTTLTVSSSNAFFRDVVAIGNVTFNNNTVLRLGDVQSLGRGRSVQILGTDNVVSNLTAANGGDLTIGNARTDKTEVRGDIVVNEGLDDTTAVNFANGTNEVYGSILWNTLTNRSSTGVLLGTPTLTLYGDYNRIHGSVYMGPTNPLDNMGGSGRIVIGDGATDTTVIDGDLIIDTPRAPTSNLHSFNAGDLVVSNNIIINASRLNYRDVSGTNLDLYSGGMTFLIEADDDLNRTDEFGAYSRLRDGTLAQGSSGIEVRDYGRLYINLPSTNDIWTIGQKITVDQQNAKYYQEGQYVSLWLVGRTNQLGGNLPGSQGNPTVDLTNVWVRDGSFLRVGEVAGSGGGKDVTARLGIAVEGPTTNATVYLSDGTSTGNDPFDLLDVRSATEGIAKTVQIGTTNGRYNSIGGTNDLDDISLISTLFRTGSVDITFDVFNGNLQMTNGAAILGTAQVSRNGSIFNILQGTTGYVANVNMLAGTFSNRGDLMTLGNVNVSGGQAVLDGQVSYTTNLNLYGGTGIIASGSAQFNQVTFDGGALRSVTNNYVLAAEQGVAVSNGGGTVIVDPNLTMAISNIVAGDGGLTKTGAGLLILSNANTYTGGTIVDQGTLLFAADQRLSADGALTVQGGVLDLNGFTQSNNLGAASFLGGLTTNGFITKTGDPFDVQGGEIAATLQGTAGLTKTGAGTAILSGSNAYSGATVIAGGSLLIDRNANAMPGGIAATGGTSALVLTNFGVLGIGSGVGDFYRYLGTQGSNVAWTGSGGFAAYGADRHVILGGPDSTQQLTWGQTDFVSGDNELVFGATDSTHTLILDNGILLTGTNRFRANDGAAYVDGRLAGDIGEVSLGVGFFVKTGDGILELTGSNTWSGGTEILGGQLLFSGANSMPNTPLNISNFAIIGLGGGNFYRPLGTNAGQVQWTGSGGFAAFNDNRVVNLGGVTQEVVWGTGSFVPDIIDGSALVLSSPDADGTLDFQNHINLGESNRTILVQEGSAAVDAILSGVLSGSNGFGGLVKQGAGVLQLSNTNQFPGTLAVEEGLVILAGGDGSNHVASASGVVLGAGSTNGVLQLGLGANAVYETLNGLTTSGTGTSNRVVGGSSDISTLVLNIAAGVTNNYRGLLGGYSGSDNNLALVKTNDGVLFLAGGNTYTGRTTISGGTLAIGADSALGADPGAYVSDQLTLDGGTLWTTNNLSPGGIIANRGITLGSGGGAFQVDAGFRVTNNAVITGVGGLTKIGNGMLILKSNSTYSGSTVVAGGVLRLDATNAITGGIQASGGLSGITLTNGGVLGLGTNNFLRGVGAGVDQIQWTGDGGFAAYLRDRTVTLGGSGLTQYWGAGSFVPDGNTLILSASDATNTITLSNPINFGGDTTTLRTVRTENGNPTTDAILSGSLMGPGGLQKTGAGGLSLSGVNTFTGRVVVSAGTLIIANENALGTNLSYMADKLTLDGGTFYGNLATLTIDDATRGIRLETNGGTFTSGANQSTIINNSIGGPGNLNLTTVTLRLNAANTYTGRTVITSGSLYVSNENALGTAEDVFVSNRLTFAGGTLRVTNNMVIDDAFRGIAHQSTATYNIDAASSLTVSNTIIGAGGLNKDGLGTLALDVSNAFTGVTTIRAGTLSVSREEALGGAPGTYNAAQLILTNNGALRATESFVINNNSRGIRLDLGGAGGGAFNVDENVTLNISNHITGAGGITKIGNGTLLLNNATNFYGAGTVGATTSRTVIAGGTLGIIAEQSLGTNATAFFNPNALIISNGALLQPLASFSIDDPNRGVFLGTGGGGFDVASGRTLTISNNIAGAGGIIKTNAGTLVLAAMDNNVGDMSVLQGILTVSSNRSTLASRDAFVTNGTLNVFSTNAMFRDIAVAAGGTMVVSNQSLAQFTNINSAGTLRVFAQTNSFQDLTATAGTVSFLGATVSGRDITVTNSTMTVVATNVAFRNIDVQRGGTFTNAPTTLTADYTNVQSAGSIMLLARTNTLVNLNILDGGGTIGGDYVQGTGTFNTTTNFSTTTLSVLSSNAYFRDVVASGNVTFNNNNILRLGNVESIGRGRSVQFLGTDNVVSNLTAANGGDFTIGNARTDRTEVRGDIVVNEGLEDSTAVNFANGTNEIFGNILWNTVTNKNSAGAYLGTPTLTLAGDYNRVRGSVYIGPTNAINGVFGGSGRIVVGDNPWDTTVIDGDLIIDAPRQPSNNAQQFARGDLVVSNDIIVNASRINYQNVNGSVDPALNYGGTRLVIEADFDTNRSDGVGFYDRLRDGTLAQGPNGIEVRDYGSLQIYTPNTNDIFTVGQKITIDQQSAHYWYVDGRTLEVQARTNVIGGVYFANAAGAPVVDITNLWMREGAFLRVDEQAAGGAGGNFAPVVRLGITLDGPTTNSVAYLSDGTSGSNDPFDLLNVRSATPGIGKILQIGTTNGRYDSVADNYVLDELPLASTLFGTGSVDVTFDVFNGTLTMTNGAEVQGTARVSQSGSAFNVGTGTTGLVNQVHVLAGAFNNSGDNMQFSNVTVSGSGVANLGGQLSFITNLMIASGGNAYVLSPNIGLRKATLDGGTMTVVSNYVLNAEQDVTLASGGGTFSVNSGRSLLVSNVIEGPGGLTKAGAGTMTLSGTAANTYTGLTMVSAGTLELNKGAGTNSIVGDGVSSKSSADILINGGTLKWLANHQLDNSVSVLLTTGGVMNINGKTDTIYDLKNYGGTYMAPRGSKLTVTDPLWAGGSTNEILGQDVYGNHEISGGFNRIHGDEGYGFGAGSIEVGAGGLVFSGNDSPTLILSADHTNAGRLILSGDVSFTGSAGTAEISSGPALWDVDGGGSNWVNDPVQSGAMAGFIDLNGGTRTFTVADGSATTDMRISAMLTNSQGTAAGITKAGAGTLELTGTNMYDGQTTVSAGTLLVNGDNTLADAVFSVMNGATLGGNGIVGGNTHFAAGATNMPGMPGAADILTFAGGLMQSNGSALLWELFANSEATRGTDFDGINISGGEFFIESGAQMTLVFNGGGSAVDWSDAFWASNRTWLVADIDFGGGATTNSATSEFAIANALFLDSQNDSLTSLYNGAQFWTYYDEVTGDLYLQYAVPEPESWALVLGGLGLVIWFRRRRQTRG